MPTASTAEGLEGRQVRQFTVFLQNKVGALMEIVKLLNQHTVEVLALSIQDSSESALARMIVSDPDRVADLFAEEDIPHGECEVLVAELPAGAGDLAKLLSSLLVAEVNIIFSYPMLIRPRGKSVLVMHVDDNECAESVMAGAGFVTLTQNDLSR